MRGRRLAGALAVAMVALGAVAWWAGQADDAKAPPAGVVVEGGLGGVLGLPSPPQEAARARRHATVEAATASCMEELGFSYEPEPLAPADADEVGLPPTAAVAADRGYGISTGQHRPAEDEVAAAEPEDSSTEREEALGTPGDPASCRGQAEAGADAEVQAILGDLETLAGAYEAAASRSVDLAELDRRWAACMAGAGHEVTDRATAFALVDERLAEAGDGADGLRAVQDYERTLAAADLACTRPLAEGYEQVQRTIGDELRDRHGDEVARVVEALGQP